YFLRDRLAEDPDFMEKNKADLCASFQQDLIDILLKKLVLATCRMPVCATASKRRAAAAAGPLSSPNSGSPPTTPP
ncbi:MAG: hypothetical protein IIT74_01555, partial [Bacteroidales bacterium]|nr:hypothetical protein [Bacteroidales bacterium]